MMYEAELRPLLRKLLCYGGQGKKADLLCERLLSEFQTPTELFTASLVVLKQMGLSESCAVLLQMILPTIRRSRLSALLRQNPTFETAEKLGALFRAALQFRHVEVFYAALLDKDFHLLELAKLSEGSVNATPLLLRSLAEIALRHNAAYIALGHNHPGGDSQPSGADQYTTKDIQEALEQLNIPLLEHFIIADDPGEKVLPVLLFTPEIHLCKQMNAQEFYTPEMRQAAGLAY